MLADELERSGNWLFRHRSWLPIAAVPVVLVGLRPAPGWAALQAWEALCLAVALVGLALRALVVGFAPRGTSGRATVGPEAEQLNTSGIYSLVRHPLYVANYLMWLGLALMSRSPAVVVIVTLLYWIYYERIIIAEEAYLERRFGDVFRAWAAHTPALLPRLTGWRRPQERLSLRVILRREYASLFAFAVLYALICAAAHRELPPHRLGLCPVTAWLLASSTLVYVTLRSLKKAGLLHVAGR